jgi:hypothetical protein
MNAREKLGVALTFVAIAILAGFLSYIFWAIGQNILAFTNQELVLVLAPCVVILVIGSILVKGRPITKVLRQQE